MTTDFYTMAIEEFCDDDDDDDDGEERGEVFGIPYRVVQGMEEEGYLSSEDEDILLTIDEEMEGE